jgi:enterochelin esterase family protein
MRSSLLLYLLGIGILTQTVTAQQKGAAKQPQGTQVRSPEILPDRSVTFRVAAPKASEVVLTGEFASGPQAMQKDGQGIWMLRVGPVDPDLYEYEISIDGVTSIDPRNPLVKYNRAPGVVSSLLDVPAAGPRFFDSKAVPHGKVDVRYYDSRATQRVRRVRIYTPPNYEKLSGRLPVLYLLHGGEGDDTVWTEFGRANAILDNLFAEKQAQPMVIVMPDGYAYGWDSGAAADKQQADFLKDLKEDLIPFVQANYRVSSNREQRALAGLSRGGAQTLNIGPKHLNLFSRLAVFSAPGGANAPDRDFAQKNAAELNAKLELFWIGMGTEDSLFEGANRFTAMLKANGVKHTYRTIPGAHTWIVWRKFLYEVAPLLWQ